MKFLKIVIAAGGAYECAMGLIMAFGIRGLFALMGTPIAIAPMIFPRTVSVLALTFGLLMLAAARDPERNLLIPVISILLRLLIQIPIVLGILELPGLTMPLIGFGAFDLSFAALTAWAIHRSGLDWKKSSRNDRNFP
jgi:hypothetical protein